jgi:tetratricopeptide (TPR) repeat protein
MPKQCILMLTVFLAAQSFAQDFKKEFSRAFTQKDTAAQMQLLQNWQKEKPDDAELFVAYFNYYFSKSKREIIRLSSTPDTSASLELKDSTGLNTVGYLSDGIDYDSDLLEKGFQYIDNGINKFPTRLDMRFGKIYALGQIENYEAFTSEIIKTIDANNQLNDRWTWTDNKKVNDPKQFFLNAIQDYSVQLYNAGDEQLSRMQQIAERVLKYYPNHVESLSNLAIVYGLQGNYDNALKHLLKAEKIAPTDFIVLNNIANMYQQKGDKRNAIKYYELTAKHGDEEAKSAAAKKLKELKK